MVVPGFRCVRTLLPIAVLATGCAGGARPGPVTPLELEQLEAQRALHPGDPGLITRSGIAHYRAGQFQLARDILAMALVVDPGSFSAAVHLGLAHEQLGDLAPARAAYARAAALKGNRAQRDEVENRLTLLGRQELALEARQAVAQEQEFAGRAPVPHTVAVLPFRYVGTDEALRPLGRGLTHLILSDLAKVGRLTLLERERVQAILTELDLVRDGHAAADGAARSGRILGAAHVVQGVVREVSGGGTVQIEAHVVHVADGRIGAREQASDRLQRLFDLEKQVVFSLLDQLGIVPTPAERRAIGERPTADLQAFLSFSRGLEAEDRGDFAAARRWFEAATTQDAGFGAARARTAEVQRLTAALRSTPDRLADLARRPTLGDEGVSQATRADALGSAVASVAPSTGDQLARRAGDPARATTRARVQEGLKRDDPTLIGIIGTLIIVVPRP